MPRSTLIRSAAFADPCDLSTDELSLLSVETTDDFVTNLLSRTNWNGGALGCLSATLTGDICRVDSATFHLLGKLWANKNINVTSLWPTQAATTLSLTIEDLSIFTFPDNSMVSNYVSSIDLQFSFSQAGVVLEEENFSLAGVSNFCLRAYMYPTSDAYAKVVLLLLPCDLAELSTNPLYLDPRFPGIRLKEVEIPLAPPPLLSPVEKTWGFPLICAIFPGSDWEDAPGCALGDGLHSALAELLCSASLPDAKANHDSYLTRLAELAENEDSLLSKAPTLFWPPAVTDPVPAGSTLGWSFFFFLFTSLFLLSKATQIFIPACLLSIFMVVIKFTILAYNNF